MRLLTNLFSRKRHIDDLAKLLAFPGNRETFLGVKDPIIPEPAQIRNDTAKMVRYSNSDDYRQYAEEVWSRVLTHLDKMLEEGSSKEKVDYHRGALKEALDLLRLSYQSRSMLKQLDSEREQSASQTR